MKVLKILILLFTSLASIEPSNAMQQDSSSYQQYSPSQLGQIQKHWEDSLTQIENQVREELKEVIGATKESNDTATQNPNNLQSNQSKKYIYGGKSGHRFFKTASEYVVIPTLAKFLTVIIEKNKQESLSNEQWDALFNATLTYLGKKRNEIAVETNTENHSEFGKKHTNVNLAMYDNLTQLSFPAWYLEMRAKVESTLKDILNKYAATHDNKPMPVNEFFAEVDKIEWLAYSYSGDQTRFPSNKSYVRIEFDYITPRGYITFKDIDDINYHFKYWHPRAIPQIGQEAMKIFKEALLDESPEKLKEDIAKLIWRMAHSSTFLRGQASIVEWLAKGLAQLHGLKIIIPDNWKGPEHMNPDQRALSNFNQEDYISLFMEKVQLQVLTHSQFPLKEAIIKRLKGMEDKQIYALTDPQFSSKGMEDKQIYASTDPQFSSDLILDCREGMEQVKNTLEASFYVQSVHLKNCNSGQIQGLSKLLEKKDLLKKLTITDSEVSHFLERSSVKLLQKLQELNLQKNNITDNDLLTFIGLHFLDLKNLKHLDLSHNHITNTGPFALTDHLESLDLSYNQINKKEAEDLIKYSPGKLGILDLSFNSFTPGDIDEIKKNIPGKKLSMEIMLSAREEHP